MAQQLLYPPEVKAGPHQMDSKAVPKGMRVNVNANHLPIFLHYSVHLTPFNAKDVPILGDILRRNVLGEQFKGLIIQSFSFSQQALMSFMGPIGEKRRSRRGRKEKTS